MSLVSCLLGQHPQEVDSVRLTLSQLSAHHFLLLQAGCQLRLTPRSRGKFTFHRVVVNPPQRNCDLGLPWTSESNERSWRL